MSNPPFEPSHAITALRAPIFHQPDIKSHIIHALSLNAQVQAQASEGHFVQIGAGAYVHNRHAAEIIKAPRQADYVAYAELFKGAPYVWGGTGAMGLDCSGLVQMALFAVGRDCPRDADMQETSLGVSITSGALQRGDLIFWPGHVGIMADANTLLHANAFHMMTEKEPYAQAAARIGPPRIKKRL